MYLGICINILKSRLHIKFPSQNMALKYLFYNWNVILQDFENFKFNLIFKNPNEFLESSNVELEFYNFPNKIYWII
jgi:hypothetical protein